MENFHTHIVVLDWVLMNRLWMLAEVICAEVEHASESVWWRSCLPCQHSKTTTLSWYRSLISFLALFFSSDTSYKCFTFAISGTFRFLSGANLSFDLNNILSYTLMSISVEWCFWLLLCESKFVNGGLNIGPVGWIFFQCTNVPQCSFCFRVFQFDSQEHTLEHSQLSRFHKNKYSFHP